MKCKAIKELLAAYLDDAVTSEERKEIEGHLLTCEKCREELQLLTSTREQLRQALQAKSEEVEPSAKAWEQVRQRITTKDSFREQLGTILTKPRWRIAMPLARFVPKTRLAWVLLPVILILIAGTVYGASSLIRDLFQKHAAHIEKTGLAQELDVSQTIDGVTVKLERAYADANVVIVGYTVSGPEKRYYTDIGELSTVDGQSIPPMTTFGSVPGIEAILGDWGNKEPSAVIAIFNTSLLQEMPAELNLKLEIHVTDTVLPKINQTATGPFILEFSLPSHSGKVIDVNQTVETAGVSITLEKVVISPWVTQAIFNFYSPFNNTNMAPIVSLELPVGESEKKCFMTTPSGQYFLGDFTDKHGECAVIISELVFPPNPPPGSGEKSFSGKAEDTKRIPGPWIFHFTVP